MALPVILAVIMGIAHYLSERFCAKCQRNGIKIISFSAGVAVSYLFLDLLPNFSAIAMDDTRFLFLTILAGFVMFHVIEKYIYKQAPKDKLLRDLALEDSIISFAYHFVVGILLVNFFEVGIVKLLLFFFPVFLYTAVSTLPVDTSRYKKIKVVLAMSTLLGVLYAMYLPVPVYMVNVLLGLLIGTLIYTVIRHSIPFADEGEPLIFAVGVILYTSIIVWTWVI
jgi:hypothetical protein